MAYEKLLNEIYAAISLEYLWPEYRPSFVKSESPDWINETMDFGLEVSQALLPEDGQSGNFIEQYLGCLKEDIPPSAFQRYGGRLHFYNGRFWAILPNHKEGQDYFYKAKYRFERKLEKLNSNYQHRRFNGLYLFLHPDGEADIDVHELFGYMRQRQCTEKVRFDWVFLNCGNVIYVCNFKDSIIEPIRLPQNAENFLSSEAERLRHCNRWADGTALDGYVIKVVRATELWQQAGVFYVRVQCMNEKRRTPLDEEFDSHDNGDTRYLLLLDKGFPIGTCRLFPVSEETAKIGKIAVLEDYRNRELGKLLACEAENWARELGFTKIVLS